MTRRISVCIYVLGIILVGAGPVQAVEPDTAPVLRIETGEHEAQLRDAATDLGGHVLVTVSDDKTARIWSLPALDPLGVLRPPIGAGDLGKLYAVAVSPDGRLAAVGGWTTGDDQAVLVFDLATRQVQRRIGGLPNVVEALAFSPDGARLAAGLFGANGIRIWDTNNWQQKFQDLDYHGDVNGIAFAPDGRFAAVSLDDSIRLYSSAGRVLSVSSLQGGQRPFRLAFSPDGFRLAVGFDNAALVEILDGLTLHHFVKPDLSDLSAISMPYVAWSKDGRILLAACDVRLNGLRPSLSWDQGGSGLRHLLDTGWSTLTVGLVTLPDGRTVLASRDGDLAMLDATGHRTATKSPLRQDMNKSNYRTGVTSMFLLARDGAQAAWVAWGNQNRWLRFDASSLSLTSPTKQPIDLVNWKEHVAQLAVIHWDGFIAPELGGHALTLATNEKSESVAVTPDGALLGSDFYLRLFGADALLSWEVSAPANAWRVNQSEDGRLAVAAFEDGTVRWYRRDNGRELLALFVTADAERWVAWTPSGYYAASPGGEDLVGWQVNRGIDQAADFFPASRYREQFYRPDVVQRVLATLDEDEAVRQANVARGAAEKPAPSSAALTAAVLRDRPPVVTILSPAPGAQLAVDVAGLDVEIRSPAGSPITRVEARLDARPAPGARIGDAQPAPALEGEVAEHRHLEVPVPAGQDANIQIIAWSGDRVSEAATIVVHGATPPAPPAVHKPRLNAVLVGVSAYQDKRLTLKFAAKDAEDLDVALKKQKDGLYGDVTIHVLPDSKATRDAILKELVWLEHATTQRDLAVVYLGGHGVAEDEEYYFLPVDADPDDIATNGISGSDLRHRLRAIPGRTVVFVDTCYAGALAGFRDLPPDITKLLNQMASAEAGVAVYSATTGRQLAAEPDALQNGIFTRAILDALSGKAGLPPEGALRLTGLAVELSDDVRVLSGGGQAATYNALSSLDDAPLFLVTP